MPSGKGVPASGQTLFFKRLIPQRVGSVNDRARDVLDGNIAGVGA